jgi:hypothetical protein
MPTTTGTSGFARILCISPRLPFSPSTTSVDRNAEACPTYPSFVLTVSEDLRFSQGKRLFECLVKRIRCSRLLELSGHTLTGSSFRIIGEEQARKRFSVLNVVESSLLEVI